MVTVTLESQHGIHLGQTNIKYYGMEKILKQIVSNPSLMMEFFKYYDEEMDMSLGLGGTNEETQNSQILGKQEFVPSCDQFLGTCFIQS